MEGLKQYARIISMNPSIQSHARGIFENSQQQVKFSTKEDKVKHVLQVCSSFGYSRLCPVARMLEKKYESA